MQRRALQIANYFRQSFQFCNLASIEATNALDSPAAGAWSSSAA
jgi:hypothetical protein